MSKIFPIKNESACVWKWSWSTFRLFNGKSSSCHRIKQVFVPLDDFDNFHNTPEVINDRALMLNGEWPQGRGCEYCKEIEDAGGMSDRLLHNKDLDLTPENFSPTDPTIKVQPKILELYLNNTCDLSCVYCIPNYSSKINEELKKFGSMPVVIHHYQTRTPNHDKYLEKLIDWLDQHGKNLKRLSLQGGEPFLQKEFDVLMDWLETKRFPNLELSFNTNLNEKPGILDSYVERYKKMLSDRKIKRVDFNCSIDCWGPQQEFIRYGLDLTNWWRNFEFLLSKKWLGIHTGHTVTSLSIKYLPELLMRLDALRQQGHQFDQTFGSVDGSTQIVYDPVFFGGDFFQKELDSCYSLLKDPIGKKRFEGVAARISNSQISRSGLSNLHVTLDEIDRRRGTDWKSLFPEIYDFFIEKKISNVV
jgi:pyruvate-formate lyase-activating enzyme